jgi:hypothetical protein
MIANALNCQAIRVLHIPPWLAWMIGGAGEFLARVRGRPSLFNTDKMREATAGSWACSAERAKAELGFRVAAPLETRLRNVAAAYIRQ